MLNHIALFIGNHSARYNGCTEIKDSIQKDIPFKINVIYIIIFFFYSEIVYLSSLGRSWFEQFS